ncbi:MAG TPA: hypothetical protein VF519_12540 [Mycobacteriales bacterium]|jgi:hypothetical protein
MKRIALLACGLAAAASFSVQSSAQADPPCFSQQWQDCLEPVCLLVADVCHPQ